MLLLLILYVYICYRWTKRIARRTEVRSSKLSFVAAVCLQMSLRIVVLSFALVLLVAAVMAMQALPGEVEAASQRGTETGLAFVIIGFPVTLLVSIFVPLNEFRRRSPSGTKTETAPKMTQNDKATAAMARSLDSYEQEREPKPPGPQQFPVSVATKPESTSSLEKELRSLAALKADGIISEEEFAAKKRALLGI